MMMKKITLTALLFLFPAFVQAGEYPLTSENTTITFEMDSTWHKFSGKAPEVSGNISIDDLNHPTKVSGSVVLSVIKMTTDDEERDEKMHGLAMESTLFPQVLYEITGYVENKLVGNLTIKEVTQPVELALTVQKDDKSIVYTGKTVIQWKNYGVKDPSIFVATVYDDVEITVIVTLPLQ